MSIGTWKLKLILPWKRQINYILICPRKNVFRDAFYKGGSFSSKIQTHFQEAGSSSLWVTEDSLFLILLIWEGCKAELTLKPEHGLKGNLNFQGILNRILQILLYHCSKQHKTIENSQFIEQNIVISFCPSLCLLRLVLPLPFSTADVLQFLDTVLCEILNVTSDHSCHCKKKTVFTITSIYVISYLKLCKV